ncbi:MAG: tRNA uridine-5-carboxymethylaminomethyl(34) synthesis GTPase MnmE, partial [Pseudomonadota bacterium]
MDTIYALSTAPGKAGVAIVRVSGPQASDAAVKLAGTLPKPRVASRRQLAAEDGSFIDDALVLAFEEGASFTGEAVVEFHLHGGLAVINAVLQELGRVPGLRGAEPGEFTRRALENGKLDLAQVEGLADLIDAETEAQRRQASRVLSGNLGTKVDQWRAHLIRAAALLEATIDFADEEVPVDVSPEVSDLLASVERDLMSEIEGVSVAERLRTGFEVAIVGRPNAGKSTLL